MKMALLRFSKALKIAAKQLILKYINCEKLIRSWIAFHLSFVSVP